MDQKTNLKKGVLFAYIAAILSGVAIFYSKISVARLSPLILASSRNFYVGLIFLLLFLFSHQIRSLGKLTKRQVILLVIVGMIGGALPFYLFFNGLTLIGAQTANLIHKTLFIWVTVLAIIFLKERPKVSYWLAFILVAWATYLVSTFSSLSLGKGELMVLAATLLWSAENVIAKKILKTVSSETVGLFRMGIGSLLLLTISIITGKGAVFFKFDGNQLISIIVGGSILFGYVYCWYKALKYAPASIVTLVLTFSVVVGNFLNGSFAGVKLLPQDNHSSLIIGISILILILSNLKTKILDVKSSSKI